MDIAELVQIIWTSMIGSKKVKGGVAGGIVCFWMTKDLLWMRWIYLPLLQIIWQADTPI